MTSSSNSPCAACKFLRRKCTHECVFAPYFPPDQPQKFVNVHKVFGASNVTKLLNELAANQREDAVNSLAYEAEARLRDPIYGCVGLISLLQNKLRQVQLDLYNAKKELSVYLGPSAMMSIPHPAMMPSHPHQGGASSSMVPYGMSSMGAGLPPSGPSQAHLMMREQQHIMDSQQLAAAVREQELMRNYEHQQELARFNSGFDGGSGSAVLGFNQMSGRAGSPSPLALVPFDNSFQVQQEPEHQHPYQQRQTAGSDEGRSSVGPSS